MKKVLQIILIFLIFSIFLDGCDGPKSKQSHIKIQAQTISGIKSDPMKYLNHEVALRGFFVGKPVPILVSDMKWVQINMPIPESEYLLLSGNMVKDLLSGKYYSAEVIVTGMLHMRPTQEINIMSHAPDTLKVTSNLEFELTKKPMITNEPVSEGGNEPEIISLCDKNPRICGTPTQITENKFALLLSGGFNSINARSRYWNDLNFMYHTLHNIYGFRKENILVIYKEGDPENSEMPVNYAANKDGVQKAVKDLGEKLNMSSTVLIYITNHGGGLQMDNTYATMHGGILDTSGDEIEEPIFEGEFNEDFNKNGTREDYVQFDELIYLYSKTNEIYNTALNLIDDEFCQLLEPLKYGKMVIILQPCFGGGNLNDLRGPHRIIMSSASEYEVSYANNSVNYDEFSSHVIAALAGQTYDGVPVNADSNEDNIVSMLEVFQYAQKNDQYTKEDNPHRETPLYEDNGDGVGHTGTFPVDGDGIYGATISLSHEDN